MSAGTFFKTFNSSDRTTTRTLLHEAIPITGSLVEGTYNSTTHSDGISRKQNIKTYSHAIFQSVYDYPHLSSSANHIFDITCGINDSTLSAKTAANTANAALAAKKLNIYKQMAQVLSGYDTSGNVRAFDVNGDFSETDDEKIENAIFINFSRLLVKDEIKKGSFSMTVGTNSAHGSPLLNTAFKTINDGNAATNYKVNSPAGEFGLLYDEDSTERPVGLIYYQAGIVVLNAGRDAEPTDYTSFTWNATNWTSATVDLDDAFETKTINEVADGLRGRIHKISFNNTTELNSTIYFCRASHNEFNYSSNPTYLDGSKIRVKNNNVLSPPRAYVTTIGLYSADNELLATAKLSEPLKKDPTNELTLRVRLDY